jgi:hypothetical protein
MLWQYYVHTLDTGGIFMPGNFQGQEVTKLLNWYGQQGWELVSTFQTAQNNGGTIAVAFIFKRPATDVDVTPPPVR